MSVWAVVTPTISVAAAAIWQQTQWETGTKLDLQPNWEPTSTATLNLTRFDSFMVPPLGNEMPAFMSILIVLWRLLGEVWAEHETN